MKKVILMTTIALSSALASAQGLYVGAGIGYTSLDLDTKGVESDLVVSNGGSASASADSSVNVYRLVVGYEINKIYAVELGYLKTNTYGVTVNGVTGNSAIYNIGLRAEVSGFDVSVLAKPFDSGSMSNVFFQLGVSNYKQKGTVISSVVGGATNQESFSESGIGTNLGFGYDLEVSKGLDARFGVTRVFKLAGESGDNVTNYSVGLIKRFD